MNKTSSSSSFGFTIPQLSHEVGIYKKIFVWGRSEEFAGISENMVNLVKTVG
jgi:hypothetical protein